MSDTENFLKPLLEMMDKRMDSLDKKIEENTALTNQTLTQAKYTNGRVTRLEKKVADQQAAKIAKKFSLSPNVIYLIAVGAVVVLIIVATLIGAPVKGLL